MLTSSGEGFPGGSVGQESAWSAEDLDLIPRSGRSPGEGNGNPLQYSCLENPMDRGAWQAMGSQRAGHDLVTKPQRGGRMSDQRPIPPYWRPVRQELV